MFSLTLESLHTDLSMVITAVTVFVVLVHLVPYLFDSHRLRSHPGPLVAKFSDAWLGYVSHQGHRSEVVHDLHRKYGQPFLRFIRVRQWLIVSLKVPSSALRLIISL